MNNRMLAAGDIFDYDLPMRWSDSDALNHMNNALYFRFMEEARVKLMMDAGLDLPDEVSQQGPVLAHSSCDFHLSITYPATGRVRHQVIRIGRSSMEHEVTLMVPDKTGDQVYARARNILVWADIKTGKSVPWPAHVLERFGKLCRPGELAKQATDNV